MLDVKSIFGKNLKKLRESLGLSQEKFSEKINLSVKTISLIENGKVFTNAENIERICVATNILPADLFSVDFNCVKNVTGSREESIDNLHLMLKTMNDEGIDALNAVARYLCDKDKNIRKDK